LFFVEKPYISDFFKRTIRDHGIQVVGTEIALQLGLLPGTQILSEQEAIERVQQEGPGRLYTTSENALAWIADNLSFSDLPISIERFKNKALFRELTAPLVPDFYFQAVKLSELANLPYPERGAPLIIKPATGFMSAGVHKVRNAEEWEQTCRILLAGNDQELGLYPKTVVDPEILIIEECIPGEEFAVDTYFDENGEAVILNILRHTFSSSEDVGDRVYSTSREIVQDNLAAFSQFITQIGQLTGVQNFPAHIELRRDKLGLLVPIEVNPLRFGGWCTTADLAYLAYGFNPYLAYHTGSRPDWPAILERSSGNLFSVIILDNSSGIDPQQILSFDYQHLLANFEKPLELREFDYRKYPVFGFLFTETRPEDQSELDRILRSDLTEYLVLNP
jgi:hypothetical protein